MNVDYRTDDDDHWDLSIFVLGDSEMPPAEKLMPPKECITIEC